MDKEQARYILQSFRPDGADADDRDFAEALAIAIQDRELCEWLANERAFDATFSNALMSVKLPESLRHDILGCLAAERGGIPPAGDAMDHAMIGAISSLQVPVALRQRVITSVNQMTQTTAPKRPLWYRLGLPLAAAAGVALAFVLTQPGMTARLTGNHKVPVDIVQANFIRAYEAPGFSLDLKREDHRQLFASLKERKLPCPCGLPNGLTKVKGIGCRELIINGKRGSIICFDERTNGVVHLVVFQRSDIEGDIPTDKPQLHQNGRWATARWQHNDKVMFLIAATDVKKLSTLF
jgi:hypothetical protein